ncbi:MAG: hypothetical protein R3F61_25295 [Myxococcota bacterium]
MSTQSQQRAKAEAPVQAAPETVAPTAVTSDNSAVLERMAAVPPSAEPSYFDGMESGEAVEEEQEAGEEGAGVEEGVAEEAPPPPDPEADPVGYAQWQLEQSEAEIAELAEKAASGTDAEAQAAYEAALKAHAEQFRDIVASLGPDEQKALLEKGGAAVAERMIAAVAAGGDPQLAAEVVGALMESGELVGREGIELLGACFAQHNTPAIRAALKKGVLDGRGALLAMSALDKVPAGMEKSALATELLEAVELTNGEFARTSEKYQALQRQMAETEARMRAADGTEEEIARWREEELAEHAELFAEYEAATKRYASTLEGQAYGLEKEVGGGYSKERLGSAFRTGMELTADLAFTDHGDAYTAAALQRKGRGERTWIDTARASGGHDERQQQLLDRVVASGGALGVAAMAASGDVDGLNGVLDGLKVYAPETAKAIAGIQERLAEIEASGLTGDDYTQALGEAFQAGLAALDPDDAATRAMIERLGMGALVGGRVFEVGKASAGAAGAYGGLEGAARHGARVGKGLKSLGRLGAAIGLVTDGMEGLQNGDWEKIASASSSFLGLSSEAFAVIGKAGLSSAAGGVGLAITGILSAYQAYQALRDGDVGGAVVAAAPLIGMSIAAACTAAGATIGLVPGMVLGAAIGSVIRAVIHLFGDSDEAREMAEGAIREMYERRGYDSKAAADLAEVFAGEDAGEMRERLDHMAKALGMSADELLDHLAESPKKYRRFFLGEMEDLELDGEGEDRKVVETEELARFRYIARQQAEQGGKEWKRAMRYYDDPVRSYLR